MLAVPVSTWIAASDRPGSSREVPRERSAAKDHLEERRPAEVAVRLQLLDQALEGEVLVGVDVEGRLPHPVEQLAEGRVAREVAAEHQGVDEEADQPLGLHPVAVGDGRADQHVVLAGVAAEQGLEGGEQDHERGSRPRAAASAAQRLGAARRQGEAAVAAAERLHGRARPVRGQLEHRRGPRRAGAPPAELLVQCLALEPVALPARRSRRTGWAAPGSGDGFPVVKPS